MTSASTLPSPAPKPVHSSAKALPRTATLETSIDDALVRRFAAGDESAFVEIMERYRGKIFAATLRLLRNHADAEEITQDTFIRAHRALANFRGDSSLATWLYRIGLNLARNRYWYFFRRRRQDSFSLDASLGSHNSATFCDLMADAAPDPAQETVSREFTSVVDHCMAGLDPHQREILTLRNVLHHTYDEIAATLGINVGTVKSRIARARESLRAHLAERFPEFAPDAAPSQWLLGPQPTYGSPVAICA
jgi:RNA polymerase sigma-70 factor (ECF subfamily)